MKISNKNDNLRELIKFLNYCQEVRKVPKLDEDNTELVNEYISHCDTELKNKVKEIAESYHDRLVFSGSSGFSQKCGCCGETVGTTVSIEHDGRDFSKDLRVCGTCYTLIATYWRDNKPNKIPPI
jgi:hypothetical protein